MSKYDHSDRLSLFRLTQQMEADQGLSEKFDPERPIDERFAVAALKVLEAEDPDSTHTICTAVSSALNHWIINSDLPIYRDGCRITDPIAVFSETHTLWEDTVLLSSGGKKIAKHRDIGPDIDYFEDRIFIHKEDFEALCKRKKLPLPRFWFADDCLKHQACALDNSPAIYRPFAGVTPDALTLRLRANYMIEVSAPGMDIWRAHASKVDLLDKRHGDWNKQACILIGLASGHRVPPDADKAVSRLRKLFKDHLGISADPFPREKSGWTPRFKVENATNTKDQRAKRDARHVSFDERTVADYPFDPGSDAAADWLKRH